MRIDGALATLQGLRSVLRSWWLPSQSIVYIGTTTQPLRKRVGAYYTTLLGARSPHAGGAWLKTVSAFDRTTVWYAETDQLTARQSEDDLLAEFARHVPPAEAARLPEPSFVLPFANLEDQFDRRKERRLTGHRRA